METTIFLVGVSCSCLIVGIYFFFVRSRPEQKPEDPQ
jgi:nitrogen fixation-related uncharacterized protein